MAGNFNATRPFIYVNGNIIDANENNPNETTIYAAHNASMNELTGHEHTGAVGDAPKLGAASIDLTANYNWTGIHTYLCGNLRIKGLGLGQAGLCYENSAVNRTHTIPVSFANDTFAMQSMIGPVGTIYPFYDFNGALSFNTTTFAYCAGQVVNVGTIGPQTLPDISGRALVGFGTDGGGNIGTAPFLTPPVGNAGNTINLQHSHTVNGHQHGPGSLAFLWARKTGSTLDTWNAAGGLIRLFGNNPAGGGGFDMPFYDAPANQDNYSLPGSGTGLTAVANPGTDNQLSATQSIQPISIRVRFIMRIL